jgi:hypothetical protein
MRLTVGPLPPAVYWRRRAVVLGALLLVVVIIAYSCSSGSAGSGAVTFTEPSPSVAAEPSATVSLLTPTIGEPPPSPPPSTAAAGAAASPAPNTGECTDAEMLVTPVPESATVRQGAHVRLTMKIRNTSNRSCSRDVGADMQELYLQQNGVKVWSSDACERRRGNDVLTFPPSHEVSYYVIWDGKSTAQGCTNRPVAPRGAYQVIGRLGTRVSNPVNLTVA